MILLQTRFLGERKIAQIGPTRRRTVPGVPESRKTLRGEEQPRDNVDICRANTTIACLVCVHINTALFLISGHHFFNSIANRL